jgi:VWFA-related protein
VPPGIIIFFAACCFWPTQASAQNQNKPVQSEDVVRVNTALVQTDVTVLDKSGGFVNGLGRDQFVLKIDGKPREISFFEQVRAGSRNEEAQLAAARGSASDPRRPVSSGALPLDRGRTIFFFADDLHLSASSVNQTRTLLSHFIDREMGQNDEAVIASTSGQIGFLQQLTDNKTVLLAAVARLKPRPSISASLERPPMSEYQALKIDQNDDDVLGFFVDETLRTNPGISRAIAEEMVHSRASQLLREAAYITTNTLTTIESLIRSSREIPGRKILFLISDGFFLDSRNSDALDRLRRISSSAAAAGTVIYSIDARGLSAGMNDVTTESAFDTTGRLQRGAAGEVAATQDGLNALAVDTGGRAFFNSNALSAAVTTALKESSTYYLLAWRPENDEQRNQKPGRVEVSVIGRPELTIRFRRRVGEFGSSESASRQSKPAQPNRKESSELLSDALRAKYPLSALPVSLTLNYVDVPQYGSSLTVSLKVVTDSLQYEGAAGSRSANLDIAGAILDTQGKPASTFSKRLTIRAAAGAATAERQSISYNHFAALKSGLYQVRVAALDEKQSRSGSAVQWIEIPDLGSKNLTLSSLIVGEKRQKPKFNQTR